ncbi:MAG: M48 family metallopeptidase [Candidatus Nealsonbacteria bacterium]|nr:M48 family metallopeptidase [Candidatus Nealsonbacteria bacterium]
MVHELCHLKEFNHSKSFWKLVSKSIPGYISKRKQLKRFRFVC